MHRFDVVIAGAGSAGSAAAWHLAKAGYSVALIDRAPLETAGPGWSNNLQGWLFDEAGIARPEPPELLTDGAPAIFATKTGVPCFRMDPTPFLAIDMRRLCTRLHDMAVSAGVTIFDEHRIGTLHVVNGRPETLEIVSEAPNGGDTTTTLHARLFVDATGYQGVLRRQHPELSRHCPPVGPQRTCHAVQYTLEIADRAGAKRFLERYNAEDGDTVSTFGMEGGFSTINLRVDLAENQAETLCGSMETDAGGPAIFKRLLAEQPWIGPVIRGGGGHIPIRRGYDRICAEGFALIGDAACQNLPAHGSGVGMGLAAARTLADAVSISDDPGELNALWRYQSDYQRRFGVVLAAYDLASRMSQQMSGPQIDTLLKDGLMAEWSVKASMFETLPEPKLWDVAGLLKAAARHPLLAARVVPYMTPMPWIIQLYKHYPEQADMRALRRWSWLVGKAFGDKPEVTR